MHKKKSLQLGERGTAARSLQRTSTDADTVRACDTNYTKGHGEDPDSWEAISLKEALFIPEGKASVLAAEAEADAVHDASSLRERKNGASSCVVPTISCRDFVEQNDCVQKLAIC